MNAVSSRSSFDLEGTPGAERSLWYRVSSSAVLVGAGIGWVSAVIACCLAAPLSLALQAGDEGRVTAHDDL
jgi:hypothetical protein